MTAKPRVAASILLGLALLLGGAPPASAAFIGTDQEVQIGRQAAAQVEAELGLFNNAEWNRRVTTIGRRVATVSGRRDLPWTFKVLNSRDVNAISLPGGLIYVTRGMMSFIRSDEELAFVLGHEVGHVDRRHHVRMIERSFFFQIVIALLLGNNPDAAQVANFARFLITRGFSREFEFEADRTGVGFTHRAGFNAAAGLNFMERLRSAEGRDPNQFELLFRTHPALNDRIIRVREQLRELGISPTGSLQLRIAQEGY